MKTPSHHRSESRLRIGLSSGFCRSLRYSALAGLCVAGSLMASEEEPIQMQLQLQQPAQFLAPSEEAAAPATVTPEISTPASSFQETPLIAPKPAPVPVSDELDASEPANQEPIQIQQRLTVPAAADEEGSPVGKTLYTPPAPVLETVPAETTTP